MIALVLMLVALTNPSPLNCKDAYRLDDNLGYVTSHSHRVQASVKAVMAIQEVAAPHAVVGYFYVDQFALRWIHLNANADDKTRAALGEMERGAISALKSDLPDWLSIESCADVK